MKEFLESRGYKWFPHPLEKSNEFAEKNSYQRKVESEALCECNGNLCVNIREWKWLSVMEKGRVSYEIELTAERKGKWWNFKVYCINKKELETQLEEIEKTLVKLFNQI